MKLGDVLAKERRKKGLEVEEVAEALHLDVAAYRELEGGESPVEEWGPRLAHIAIVLETPTARLLADSGRASDCRPGQAGQLIRGHRERRELTVQSMVVELEGYGSEVGLPTMTAELYATIEDGTSPIETCGPLLLGFAELIEQPFFNLFYPCGLPFQELDDYP